MKRSASEGLRWKSPRPLVFAPVGDEFESRRGHSQAVVMALRSGG